MIFSIQGNKPAALIVMERDDEGAITIINNICRCPSFIFPIVP